MGRLQQETEPALVGLDAGRLARLDRHFARYVDDGRLAGFLLSVARHGRVAHLTAYGLRDREAGLPVEPDTIWRIQSMTKPITAVALLTLYEEGLLALTDPLARYLPAFADTQVYVSGDAPDVVTRRAAEPIRLWHLLTHTAGLTYGFFYAHPVDAVYRAAGFESSRPAGLSLAEMCDGYASFPLLFEPGTAWNYSVSFDVLGRVIEVVSGQDLDEFFAERIFGPLGMDDAGYWLGAEQARRLATRYTADEAGLATPTSGWDVLHRPEARSGGGMLLASAYDYHRFMEMLRRRGELDGVRLLAPRTVDFMASNHLPGGADLPSFTASDWRDPSSEGAGYGLGVSVAVDPVASRIPVSVGDYGWSGAENTHFWVSPRDDLTVQFMTQLNPPPALPILTDLRQMLYQAVLD